MFWKFFLSISSFSFSLQYTKNKLFYLYDDDNDDKRS